MTRAQAEQRYGADLIDDLMPMLVTPAHRARPADNRIKVVCLECARKFATASLSPRCPKCGGVDIEVR